VATTEQAQEVHAFIRSLLTKLFGEALAQKVRGYYDAALAKAQAHGLVEDGLGNYPYWHSPSELGLEKC
jgi:triosephosphate isomerase